ncbi:MAG TPA: class I SAM-dependent methyltransferase [Chitinophagaceae bacterium]|nr:class I SAM-dependent methyltransferase [Chitinophagaceae bacterium]HQZ78706.1 class I SAM-dependent methyltransferase [Bacteroidia bacterium]
MLNIIDLTCPLCLSKNIKKLFIKEGISYYSCLECRFVFSLTKNNANLENNISDFETSYLQYFDEKSADEKNHLKMLRWINKTICDNPKSILDIGSGSGKFVNYLNNLGLMAYGIEPSISLYNHFLSGSTAFFCGSTEDFIEYNPGKQFDVITAFDVLEHTKHPVDFLQSVSKLMHPSSYLFMSMPDVNSIHRKITQSHWHYFNKYHFSYFSKKTLKATASKAGLSMLFRSHKSRYFQVQYIQNYFMNFVLLKKSTYSAKKGGLIIPMNLFDNMYCVFKKI